MRLTLILFALACAPAFCQNNIDKTLTDNLRQRLTDALNPQNSRSRMAVTTLPPTGALAPANECSVPLLKAASPFQPVPMPNPASRPVGTPPSTSGPSQSRLDRMTVVAPAPSCQAAARMAPTAPPAPTPPAPTTAP